MTTNLHSAPCPLGPAPAHPPPPKTPLSADLALSITSHPLASVRCFHDIQGSAPAMRALAARLQPLHLPAGFTLCEEGEEATACWVLQEGERGGTVAGPAVLHARRQAENLAHSLCTPQSACAVNLLAVEAAIHFPSCHPPCPQARCA